MASPLYDESQCIAACAHIAREIVRPLALEHFERDTATVAQKYDRSVVTDADREIEARIRSYLAERFPDFGLLGEELGAERTDREYVWTIDPIDGTEAFVAGLPLFGTLLGVIRQDAGGREPVLGAIYLPVQDRLVVGNRAQTTIDGRRIVLNGEAADVLLLGDISACAKHLPQPRWEALRRLALKHRAAQTWGDCFGYLSLLTGKARARIECGLGVDDIAPLEPVILGAGGMVSAFDGTPLAQALSALDDLADPVSFDTLCAVSSEVHAGILRDLAA